MKIVKAVRETGFMESWYDELYFVALALILAFGILEFSGTVMGTESPVVSVVSCSMYPEYDRGDVLMVRGQDFDDIQEGDVIVFEVPYEVELEHGGDRFTVGEESSGTSLGDARVRAVSGQDAVIEIEGDRYQVRNGGSYTVDGETITVRSVKGTEMPVVHRVIEKRSDSLETQGDNTEQHDFETDIRPEQIHGTAFIRIPKIGLAKLLPMDMLGLSPPEQREEGLTCGS